MRGTTHDAGGQSGLGNLLASHSAACALAERARILLRETVALERQLSRTISSRTGATHSSSGKAHSKASARNVTRVPSKPRKTSKGRRALTDGQRIDAAVEGCKVCRNLVASLGRDGVRIVRSSEGVGPLIRHLTPR